MDIVHEIAYMLEQGIGFVALVHKTEKFTMGLYNGDEKGSFKRAKKNAKNAKELKDVYSGSDLVELLSIRNFYSLKLPKHLEELYSYTIHHFDTNGEMIDFINGDDQLPF